MKRSFLLFQPIPFVVATNERACNLCPMHTYPHYYYMAIVLASEPTINLFTSRMIFTRVALQCVREVNFSSTYKQRLLVQMNIGRWKGQGAPSWRNWGTFIFFFFLRFFQSDSSVWEAKWSEAAHILWTQELRNARYENLLSLLFLVHKANNDDFPLHTSFTFAHNFEVIKFMILERGLEASIESYIHITKC